jgi:YfiR/HmsC-like
MFVAASLARAEDVPEYRLKAAFLYNFAAFTEWPAELGTTLTVCLHGADLFGAEIDTLNGKLVGTRTVEVQRRVGLESLKACQLVFVSSASIGQLPRVLEALRGVPALVVADSPGALRQGVALNMNIAQGRVSFEANLVAARAARLKLSSHLLRLATEVIQ